jgi:hypothetical protein
LRRRAVAQAAIATGAFDLCTIARCLHAVESGAVCRSWSGSCLTTTRSRLISRPIVIPRPAARISWAYLIAGPCLVYRPSLIPAGPSGLLTGSSPSNGPSLLWPITRPKILVASGARPGPAWGQTITHAIRDLPRWVGNSGAVLRIVCPHTRPIAHDAPRRAVIVHHIEIVVDDDVATAPSATPAPTSPSAPVIEVAGDADADEESESRSHD